MAAISINADDCSQKSNEVLPINIEIADKKKPEKIEFMTCNWDYITSKTVFTKDCIDEAVTDLTRHYLNVTVISPSLIIQNNSSAEEVVDKVLINSDLTNDLLLRRHADFILLFLGFGTGREYYFGQDIYTKEWEVRFRDYIRKLSVYMGTQGYEYGDYAVYPYDERLHLDFIHVAKTIRQVDPRIKIYANCVANGIKDIRKAKGLVDIWCPPLDLIKDNANWLEEIKSFGCEVWSYGSQSKTAYAAGNLDLFAPLHAVALGINGAGFWVYSDWGGGHFNDYNIRGYGVVYDGREAPEDCIFEPIVPSKRWQIWRERVEDAIALRGHTELLQEFMDKPADELTSEYLTSLRKRADGVSEQY